MPKFFAHCTSASVTAVTAVLAGPPRMADAGTSCGSADTRCSPGARPKRRYMPRSSVTTRTGSVVAPDARVSTAATVTPGIGVPRPSVMTPVIAAPGSNLIATSTV